MDGQDRNREVQSDLMTWQSASTICHHKLSALERLLSQYNGADRELLEILVERERDICAQLRNRISALVDQGGDGT